MTQGIWILEGWNATEGTYILEVYKYEPNGESFGVEANGDYQAFWMTRCVDEMPETLPENERISDFAHRFEKLTGINPFISQMRASRNFAKRSHMEVN